MVTMQIEQFSEHLQERIRRPKCRGQYVPYDSADTQLGLLSVGNGEAKVYVLIDPKDQTIQKAKFLAFGQLGSILVLDAYCSVLTGRPVSSLIGLNEEHFKGELSFTDADPSLDFSFLSDFSMSLAAGISGMVVEEPIADKPGAYRRKDKADMSDVDLAWLPISAPQKIARVEEVLAEVIPKRTAYVASQVSLYNVERDLKVKLNFSKEVESAHIALILGFIQGACRSQLHPEITVEEVES